MPIERRAAPLPILLAGLCVAGCPTPPDPGVPPDAFRVVRDGGPDVGIDAFRPDAGPPPDTGPPPDASSPDGSTPDAGSDAARPSAIVVDGRLVELAWSSALERSTAFPSIGIFDGTQITRFLVLRTESELHLAFEGAFPSSSTVVVVYVDTRYPDTSDGVLLGPSGLGDRSGEVDGVLSNALTAVDATFRPEAGWGAARLPEAVTTGSPTLGWRLLSQTGAHAQPSGQRSACSATACETSIALASIGVAADATIALAVRIGDTVERDLWAPGQTIPNDPDPEFVTAVEPIPPTP